MRVQLHADVVPPPALAALRAAAPGVAAAPNFWVPRAAAEAGPAAAATAAAAAVALLYERVMRDRLPADWAGAEYWVQARAAPARRTRLAAAVAAPPADHAPVGPLPRRAQRHSLPFQIYEPGRGLAFHFDKDEHLLAAEGRMAHPAWSSVLYLTGGDGDGAPREGAPRAARARGRPLAP